MTPNFFVLGAGKSGTTSLWPMLRQHPDIHMSTPKEPTFFCHPFQVVRGAIAYFALFDSPRRWRGDASHGYLTNPPTAAVLADLFPAARFIVILRDPARRAFALYRQMRRLRHADGAPCEEIGDFTRALTAEDARAADPAFAATCRHYLWNFLYVRSSAYDEQLSRYLALFDRGAFHVLTLADLSLRPQAAVEGIAAHLDVDPGPLAAQAPTVRNADPAPRPMPDDARALLAQRLAGVTARTDALLGQALDWSL
jgi:hypothetical protein